MARQRKFESCAYTTERMVEFISKYLGPTVKAKHPKLQIIAYDHNKVKALEWMQAIYGNASSSSFVSGTAVHWYDYSTSLALAGLDGIHDLEPDRFILNTEACTLRSLKQNWKDAALYMVDVIGDLNHWVNGWMFWNQALLDGDKYPYALGGPNHDNTTSFGDPLLFEFDKNGTQRLVFQPSYWVLGHFSRFARPGATIVVSGGQGVASDEADYEAVRAYAVNGHIPANATKTGLKLLTVAFKSPDGATAGVVVANPNDETLAFKLSDGTGRATNTSIPAKAVQTYTWTV